MTNPLAQTDQDSGQSPSKVMPALTFAALAGTMSIVSFTAVMGPLVRALELREWHAGLAMTSAGVFWMLLARPWGKLSDRIGRKKVLLGALAASSTAYLLLAIAMEWALSNQPEIWISVALLVGLRSLIGAFHSAIPPTAAALVADESTPETRASSMAKLGAANSLGMVMGPAVAGWLAAYHLSIPLFGAALLPCLAMIILWWRLPAGKSARELGKGPAAKRISLFDARLRLPALVALIAMLSVSVAQVSVGFYSIDKINLTHAQGAKVAGLALTCVGVGLMFAQFIVIRCKNIQPAKWICLGTFLSSVGFASAALIVTQEQLLMAYGLAAFGMGFTMPSIQALAANAVGPAEQGVAAGTVASMQGMGTVVGPIAGTALYSIAPEAPYFLVSALLLTLSISLSTVCLQRS